MNKLNIKVIFVSLFFLIMIFPLLTFCIGKNDPTFLAGVDPKYEFPSMNNKKAWRHKEFQPAFEKFWQSHFGYRAFMLKTKNTIYDFINFGLIHSGYSATLIETTNHRLVADGDITFNFFPVLMNRNDEKEFITNLKKINNLIKTFDKKIIFVFAEKAPDLYSDEIPLRFKFFSSKNNNIDNYYEKLEEIFRKSSITYINAFKIMKDIKYNENIEPYNRTGCHWNDYADFKITEAINNKIDFGAGKLLLKKLSWDTEAKFRDRDHSSLLNTYFSYLKDEKFPHVQAIFEKNLDKNFFIVGDSFSGSVSHLLTTVQHSGLVTNVQNRPITQNELQDLFLYDIFIFLNTRGQYSSNKTRLMENLRNILESNFVKKIYMHDFYRNTENNYISNSKSEIRCPNLFMNSEIIISLKDEYKDLYISLNSEKKIKMKKDNKIVINKSEYKELPFLSAIFCDKNGKKVTDINIQKIDIKYF